MGIDAELSNRAVQRVHHEVNEVPDPPRILKVVRRLEGVRPGKLLDVGYCKGSFADHLAERGWDCTGLDLCPRPARRVKIVTGDAHRGLPFPDEAFDLVTAGELIEHMIDQGEFLRECRRVLRPGGLLALTTPNLAFSVNRVRLALGLTPLFVWAPYHYHFHTADTLGELLAENGFALTDLTASHVLYSSRRHPSGRLFERLADWFPTLGAHLIALAERSR